VELASDQIGGLAVHLANRIMGEAGPGAVLVSTTVKDLVLGSGIVFADQGPQLRGAPVTWNLFQVTSVP